MKTIMLLSGGRFNLSVMGDSFWLKLLKTNGYRVLYFVKKHNVAIEWADNFWVVDHWDYGLLKQVAVDESVDLILHFTDFSGGLVARLNEELGLPGINQEQYQYLHDKALWPGLLAAHGAGTLPQCLITEQCQFDVDGWDFPIIVKATASSSSISDKPYGYQFYPSLQAFKCYLVDKGLMDGFLSANRLGTSFGQYVIQKKLVFKRYYFVNLIVASGEIIFDEINEHKVYEDSKIHYEAYGPVSLAGNFEGHYKVLRKIFLQHLELTCAHISFDMVEDVDGNIYTLDINSRMGTRFSASLYHRDADSFGLKVVESFLQKSNQCPEPLPTYLLKYFEFFPGTVKSIKSEAVRNGHVAVLGAKYLKVGAVIPDLRRERFPMRALICDGDLDSCHDVFLELMQNISITYV
jgi:hypothetical protein